MTATGRALAGWGVREGPFGIRLFDVGVVALVIVAIEVNVVNGGGPGAVPLNAWAYLFGALLAVPILFRHRWPLQVLIASAVVMFFYYIFARRNISPAPVFFVPLYDAAVVGYLALAIAIPAVFMVIGLFVVEVSVRQGIAARAAEFQSQIVILALAVMLGEVVRSRRALTAETARRLRLAQEERAAEAGRAVAEERLRIARELHDTVAHGMATIAVQAGSALHVLGDGGRDADMVVVFGSFVLTPDVSVKQIGLGLAAAVLVDATVVRLVLVPAVMELLGPANWWLPGWLEAGLAGGCPGRDREGAVIVRGQSVRD